MTSTTPTLIYDGECALCRRWVSRVQRWDRDRRLADVTYQTPDLPRALGQGGGSVVKGWNAANRLEVGRHVKPGQEIQLAVFGMNGPISNPVTNYIWMRTATLEFYPGSAEPEAIPPQEVRPLPQNPQHPHPQPPHPLLTSLHRRSTFRSPARR